MNKKGIAFFLNIMLAVTVIIVIFALSGSIKQSTDIARNSTNESLSQYGMDCVLANGSVNSTLTNFQAASCIATDLTLPLYVWIGFAIGGAILIAKLVLQ